MKTKVIEHEVFEEIQKRSFAKIESELREAAKKLSGLAGRALELKTVNEDYVVYGPVKNSNVMLKARYQITDKDTIKLSNFEKIKVDESSKIVARKNVLRSMIDALGEDDKDMADECWKQFLGKYTVSEMVKKKAQKAGCAPKDAGCCNADEEDQEAKGKKRANQSANRGKYGSLTTSDEELMDLKAVDDALEEWTKSLPNYLEIKKQLAEAAKQVAEIVCEEKTDAIKIKMKDKKPRDEEEDEEDGSKEHEDEESEDEEDKEKEEGDEDDDIDEIEIDMKDKEDSKKKTSEKSKKHRDKVKKERDKFAGKEDDEDFDDEVVKLKRDNNAQDEVGVKETLMNIVSTNPSLIYVSKNELHEMISRILTKKDEKNWNDNLCEDIAFALKKLAHSTYADKAYDMIKFAAVDQAMDLDEEVSDDDYEAFEQVSERYFNNIYSSAAKQSKALTNLSEMLARTATTLESDAKAAGLNKTEISKLVAEYRQYASQMAANARGPINENLVRTVVGSLLTRVADDYSLNQLKFVDPGHFHKSIDLDDDDYEKWTGKAGKDSRRGDEEMRGAGNTAIPKSMGKNQLDLTPDGKIRDFNVMKNGVNANPTAPKAKTAKDLDLS